MSESAPSDFDQEELSAILSLDFERAIEISRHKCQDLTDQAADEEEHYREQAVLLSQQNYEAYNEKLNEIREEYQQSAEKHKTVWQGYCRTLVKKQREEADALEMRWREARAEEMRRTTEVANARLSTARILAMCNQFENAIEVRDSAQKLIESEKTSRVHQIDIDFAKRYRKMTARHFSEFQYLHKHLTSLMDTMREKVKAQKMTAEADLMMEEARNASLIIQTVSKEAVSPVAKENVIRAFSPRGQRRSGSRSYYSMSRSSARTSGRTTPTVNMHHPTPVGH